MYDCFEKRLNKEKNLNTINLNQYDGNTVAVLNGLAIDFVKTEELKSKPEKDLKKLVMHPVKEIHVDALITDISQTFLEGIQDNIVKLDADDLETYWTFIKNWTKKIVKKHGNQKTFEVCETTTIVV